MQRAFTNARLAIGAGLVAGQALIVEDGHILSIVPTGDLPSGVDHMDCADLILGPGLIDTQVNGGGGLLFNDAPTVETIAAMGAAHARFGTTAFLPTLISDELDVIDRAMRAVEDAIAAGIPGVIGIHIEGPFLNAERRGIHDSGKFRVLDDAAIELLGSLRQGITLVTLAPERTNIDRIGQLVARGVIVSAGHSNATYNEARAAFAAGVTGVTHLFNAMSPLTSRAPNLVGAALEDPEPWCGIIVDGFHVDPAVLRLAMRVRPLERFMLVTDAMPTVGSASKFFTLGGRLISAEGGVCKSEDGTLAGSDLDMATAVRNAVEMLGLHPAEALSMASEAPARFLGLADQRGRLSPGACADFVLFDDDHRLKAVWRGGEQIAGTPAHCGS